MSRSPEGHVAIVSYDGAVSVVGPDYPRGRTMPPFRLPDYPPPEYMNVADAARFFSVNETMLRNALLTAGTPVLGKDSWGNDLYLREDIRKQLGR
jgi:hypothetical protein